MTVTSKSGNFSLRILKPDDVSEQYVNWYKDEEVVRFSDNQYRNFTFDGQKKYVKACLENKDIDLYGIFSESLHIGNISLNGLESIHKRAELTYVIGDKSYWNRGAASFAISEIIKKSRSYGLNKLYAGLAHLNIGSKMVLEKNGFVLEGVRRSHLFYNNTFYDQLDYGLILA